MKTIEERIREARDEVVVAGGASFHEDFQRTKATQARLIARAEARLRALIAESLPVGTPVRVSASAINFAHDDCVVACRGVDGCGRMIVSDPSGFEFYVPAECVTPITTTDETEAEIEVSDGE